MPIDYAALWVVAIVNSLAILLLIRQLATLPQFSRRSGPKTGTAVEPWSLETLDGAVKRSIDLPDAYTLLFVSSTCGPCHTLFAELRRSGRPPGVLYVVAQGDGAAFAPEVESDHGPLYDLFLLGGRGELYQNLGIPGTPWALAVRQGRVVAGEAASTPDQLSRVCGATITGQQLASNPL